MSSNLLGVKKENKSLLVRTYLLFFCTGMLGNSLGSTLKCLRSSVYGIGCSASFQGTLSSMNFAGNMIALIIAGYLPFIIGKKNSLVILGATGSIGLFIMILTGNPALLILAFLFCGTCRGTVSNVTNVIIGEYTENKTAGLNLLHATFAVGAVLSPMTFAFVNPSSWRIPTAVISIALVFALLLIHTSSLDNNRGKVLKTGPAFPKEFKFWNITFILFCYLCMESSLISYLVSFFTYSRKFSDAFGNAMSSLLWLTMLVGRLIIVGISKKLDKNQFVMLLTCIVLSAITMMVLTSNQVISVISVGILGLGMSGIYPTTLSTQDEKYNKSTTATGICLSVATCGAIIYPIVVGLISDARGYLAGMTSLLIPVVSMMILVFIKLRNEKKEVM